MRISRNLVEHVSDARAKDFSGRVHEIWNSKGQADLNNASRLPMNPPHTILLKGLPIEYEQKTL